MQRGSLTISEVIYMAKKSIIEAVGTFFSLALALPIWFYIVHWLLKTNGAGELHVFLFVI